MQTRRFGRTELPMPPFSCGGMRFMHKWKDHPIDEIPSDDQRNLEETLRRAISLGLNHVETARGYGSSERQLGQVLPRLRRDDFILQTKVSPKADPAQFVTDFHDSLDRLGVDHVDLLGLHGINDEQTLEWATRRGGCFDAAQELRRAGKVRFVGFSTHADTEVIRQAIAFGEPEVGRGFDYVNLHWYFIYQRNWPAILDATARDMGVFIISPSDKGGHLYRPPDRLRRLCEPLSPMQLNDLFCLSHPEVHTLSVGAARPSDFDEHLSVLPLLERANELLPPIVERLRGAMKAATGHEDPEHFSRDLPRWMQAPAELNLRVMLWLRSLALGWDMVEYGKARMNLLGNGGHWFPGAAPGAFVDVSRQQLQRALGPIAEEHGLYEKLGEVCRLLEGEKTQRESAG